MKANDAKIFFTGAEYGDTPLEYVKTLLENESNQRRLDNAEDRRQIDVFCEGFVLFCTLKKIISNVNPFTRVRRKIPFAHIQFPFSYLHPVKRSSPCFFPYGIPHSNK